MPVSLKFDKGFLSTLGSCGSPCIGVDNSLPKTARWLAHVTNLKHLNKHSIHLRPNYLILPPNENKAVKTPFSKFSNIAMFYRKSGFNGY